MSMKQAALKMSIMMGLAMSFTLTLTGLVSAGQFTLRSFLLNFIISFTISFVLGQIIPIRKITTSVMDKMQLKPGTLKARLMEALISDVSYTPIMTFIMVFIAHRQATAHGARMPFGPMLLKSECISLVAAFIMIFLLSPILMKIAFKGVDLPQGERK